MDGLPVVWAEFAAQRETKDLFRRMGVLTLPTIHFYDGSMLLSSSSSRSTSSSSSFDNVGQSNLIENFPCPPAKVPLLKKKLARFLNARVDPTTRVLLPPPDDGTFFETTSSTTAYNRATLDTIEATAAAATMAATTSSVANLQTIDVTDATTYSSSSGNFFETADQPRQTRQIVMDNELVTEEHIDYLRYGMPFFRDLTDDEFDTLLSKARLLTFDVGDIICKQGMPGTTFYVLKRGVVEMSIRNRFEDPIRTPPSYLGVVVGELNRGDYFGERALSTGEPLAASFRVVEKVRCFAFPVEDIPESSILSRKRRATREMIEQLDKRYELPDDYRPYTDIYSSEADQGKILDLLVRFKQIRQAAKCWNYIMNVSFHSLTWICFGLSSPFFCQSQSRTVLITCSAVLPGLRHELW